MFQAPLRPEKAVSIAVIDPLRVVNFVSRIAIAVICRLCNDDEEETSWHVFARCPALMAKRLDILGHSEFDDPTNFPWDPGSLLSLIRELDRLLAPRD